MTLIAGYSRVSVSDLRVAVEFDVQAGPEGLVLIDVRSPWGSMAAEISVDAAREFAQRIALASKDNADIPY